MAVYTDVTDEALEAFLTEYDIGELASFKGIAEGVENSNFLLSTDQDQFILTLYEKRVNPADLPYFLGLMEHLSAGGLNCPLPIKRRDGELLGELAGRPAAVISFLNGVSVRRPSVEHCGQLGAAMAKLHAASDGFSISRTNSLTVSDWRPLFNLSKERANTVQDGLEQEIEAELAFLEDQWPGHLPKGIIHADLFPDNVFFLKGELSGIIDFYFACNDMLAYDLAICLNAWCFEADASFNVTKARAMLKGYESVRPLSDAEHNALPLLCRGAALRFLLTRLYDWLEVPEGALVIPKNPLEYWRKLRFHQQVLTPSDYGLNLQRAV